MLLLVHPEWDSKNGQGYQDRKWFSITADVLCIEDLEILAAKKIKRIHFNKFLSIYLNSIFSS